MNQTSPDARDENRQLRQAAGEAGAMLENASQRLRAILQNEATMAETPIEAQAAIESATEAIGTTLRRLQLDSAARPAVQVLTSSSSQ